MQFLTGPESTARTLATPRSRYRPLGLTLGGNTSPSQQRRRVGHSAEIKQFFDLTNAQKQMWHEAAQLVTWQDIGGKKRSPTARQLYNRLNRSRHRYCPQYVPVEIPPLASLDEPPTIFSTPIDFTSASLIANVPYNPAGPPDPYPQLCVTAWEWVQTAYQPTGGTYTPITPWQQTTDHPCSPTSGDETTQHEGTAFTPQTPAQMEAMGYFQFPAPQSPPVNEFFWYRATADNGYPNYDPFSGGALLTVERDPAMCIAVDVYWNTAAQSFEGKGGGFHYCCAIASNESAFREPNGLLSPVIGGQAMPFIGANDAGAWGPFSATNDIAVMLTEFGSYSNEGETIRLRLWPFTVDGWPGSVMEIRSVYGPVLPYGPCPDCPPSLQARQQPCGCL